MDQAMGVGVASGYGNLERSMDDVSDDANYVASLTGGGGNYSAFWSNVVSALLSGGDGSTYTSNGDGTGDYSFSNSSDGAWQVTNQWNKDYIQMFQSQASQIAQEIKNAGGTYTCEDFALTIVATFAMQNNLPMVIQTGAKTFDASSSDYNNFDDFLHDIKTYSAAADLQNNNNTTRENLGSLKDGDLILLDHISNGIAHHVQTVTNVSSSDDGSIIGVNIMQGNFGNVIKHLGSNDPNAIFYYGVPVQAGYWDVQTNNYYNWSKNSSISNYSSANGNFLEFREWNFMNWNK